MSTIWSDGGISGGQATNFPILPCGDGGPSRGSSYTDCFSLGFSPPRHECPSLPPAASSPARDWPPKVLFHSLTPSADVPNSVAVRLVEKLDPGLQFGLCKGVVVNTVDTGKQ